MSLFFNASFFRLNTNTSIFKQCQTFGERYYKIEIQHERALVPNPVPWLHIDNNAIFLELLKIRSNIYRFKK